MNHQADTSSNVTDPKPGAPVILEAKQRFSRSIIWALQRNFYQNQGIQAWMSAGVPHYITNNPFIADAYARVVFGWLRDWYMSGEIILDQPVYLIELGTGTGRFAFQFMKQFFRLLDQSPLHQIKVKYVMTDFVGQNSAFWQSHPALQPFIASGRVDIADFDAEQLDKPLYLRLSAETLTTASVKNPVAVLANYFFDVLPADLFRLRQGALYETLVTVTSDQTEPNLADSDIIKRMGVSYDDVEPALVESYYTDPILNQVLFGYRDQLGDTMLLIPALGAQDIGQFNRLANGRLMLVMCEKGHSQLTDLAKIGSPGIAVQGGFSLMVNIHAIRQYVQQLGGEVLDPTHRSPTLYTAALLTGQTGTNYFDARLAYKQTFDENGPADFFLIKKLIESHCAELSLEQILAYLRQSQWDSYVFHRCFPTLMKRLESYPLPLREDVRNAIANIWDIYFHLNDPQDLPFCLATTLQLIGDFPGAIKLFEQSLSLYGDDPNTFYNLAACSLELEQFALTLDYLNKTLSIAPDFESALAMREHVISELKTPSS